MSVRPNAPYRDRLEDGETTLVYEGHDQPKGPTYPNPKVVDQSERFPSGRLTQNGKFHEAAQPSRSNVGFSSNGKMIDNFHRPEIFLRAENKLL